MFCKYYKWLVASIFISVLYFWGILTMHIPGKKDVVETHEVYDFIWEQISNQPNIKLYVSPKNYQNIIAIYGLTDVNIQEKLILKLGSKIKSTKWKPLVITFYIEENWVQKGNRRIRYEEKVIRTKTIK